MVKRDFGRHGAKAPGASGGAHFRVPSDVRTVVVPKNDIAMSSAHAGVGQGGLGSLPGHRPPLKRALMVLAATLVLCGVGGAVAWFGSQDNVTNVFTRGEIKPSIEETFDASFTVKENVAVKNEGTAPAYMRATVSVYWEDGKGNQLWETPAESADYTIAWGSAVSEGANPRWILGDDDYYYWSVPVGPNEQTQSLIDRATQVNPVKDKRLVVDISTQALQANLSTGEGFDKVWSASSGLKVGADGALVRSQGVTHD